jgi:hypothetical protein
VRSRDYEEFIEFLAEARYLEQDKADLKVLRRVGKKSGRSRRRPA